MIEYNQIFKAKLIERHQADFERHAELIRQVMDGPLSDADQLTLDCYRIRAAYRQNRIDELVQA